VRKKRKSHSFFFTIFQIKCFHEFPSENLGASAVGAKHAGMQKISKQALIKPKTMIYEGWTRIR